MIKLVNKDSGKIDQYQMSEEIASGKYWTTIDCARRNGGSVDLSKAAYLQMSVYNNSDASAGATGWSLKRDDRPARK